MVDGLIGFSLLLLSTVSLIKGGYKNSVNRLFAVFSLLTAVWLSTNYMGGNVNLSQNIALIANYFTFAAGLGVVILLMQFVIRVSDAAKLEIIVKRSLIPLWTICFMCFTPLIVASIVRQDNTYAVETGPLMILYIASMVFVVSMITYGMIHGLKKNIGAKKRQLVSIGIGLLVSVPAVILLTLIIPVLTGEFSTAEIGVTPVVFLVISIYYSVVKYRLLDIKLAVIRTFAYALSLLSLSAIYYVIAYLLSLFLFKDNASTSLSINPINIALALLLAFVFQPIKQFFDKVTNKVFFKDNYNSDDFFTIINKTLSSTIDLRGMLERVSVEIAKTLKGDQAFFYINVDEDHFITAGTAGHKLLPKADAKLLENIEETRDGIIIASMLEDENDIRRMMISHRLELVLPLIKDKKIFGYLCLGDHLTSSYKNRDIKVLNTISNGLIIAIQNALAVQEIREFNETLKQRITNATVELRTSNRMLRQLDKAKDEFVGMASHQLRTPLTSVKGYISMVIDGDAGEITDSQKQLLDEAFKSSERMVNLINDFLNVSRIQTGKFMLEKSSIDLSKLVGQEIDSLQSSATAHNLKFIYNQPKGFPAIDIDESKIRQVVMNFIDNSIYYSHEKAAVEIKLLVESGEAVFTVKDSGIGVPINERSQLFTKFYRASNARKKRPDGTGVGLYLAKTIIDAHEGKVIFESSEGGGSTFGFRLPLK